MSDADDLRLPAAWGARVLPRRGGRIRVGPSKVNERTAFRRMQMGWAARRPWLASAFPDVMEAVDAQLGIAADRPLPPVMSTEAEAALCFTLANAPGPARRGPDAAHAVDYWLCTEGFSFALRTALATLRVPNAPETPWWDVWVLAPLRHHVATLGDAEYRRALQDARGTADRSDALALAVVFPTERELVEVAVAASPSNARLLGCDLSVERACEVAGAHRVADLAAPAAPDWLVTLVDGLGTEVTEVLSAMIDDGEVPSRLREVLAALPTDDAFEMLLRLHRREPSPELAAVCERFPERAARLLAPVASTSEERALVRTAAGAVPTIAPNDAIPSLLVTPPWLAPSDLETVKVRKLDHDDGVVWQPGERERWLALQPEDVTPPRPWSEIAKWRDHIGPLGAPTWLVRAAANGAPPEVAREIAARWQPEAMEDAQWLPFVVAKLGAGALPAVAHYMEISPRHGYAHAAPLDAASLAFVMARAVAERTVARDEARAWLMRHPRAAAVALIPPAVRRARGARMIAQTALRALVEGGHGEAVREVAGRFGAKAAQLVEREVFDHDPLSQYPRPVPSLPRWVEPTALQAPELEGGLGELPPAAVRHLAQMLLFESGDSPSPRYAGIDAVKDACTRESLGRFAWSIVERWLEKDAPRGNGWVLRGLISLGTEREARELAAMIRRWYFDKKHARARDAVGVLASMDSDASLMQLSDISTRFRKKGLRLVASRALRDVAKRRGLTAPELAARTVPTFGLRPDGSLALPYGPRQFTVGFDELLRPFVLDPAGKRLRSLPKPKPADDANLAKESRARFDELKKQVREVAKQQIKRFERAMVRSQRWPIDELLRYVVEHPLLMHVARRLVWGVVPDRLAPPTTFFRPSEDRTLTDVDDEPVELDRDAHVSVVHPIHLDQATAARWGDLFGEYEILQPFDQLGRTVYRRDEPPSLEGLSGHQTETVRLLGLDAAGWAPCRPDQHGWVDAIQRDWIGGTMRLELEPGFRIFEPKTEPTQRYTLSFGVGKDASTLDDVRYSELVRDLVALRPGDD